MAACEFDFTVPASPEPLRRALEADFARFGGVLTDDGGGVGAFSLPTPLGLCAGDYRIEAVAGGSAIWIGLETKPIFLPCSKIEEHLARRLQKAAAASG